MFQEAVSRLFPGTLVNCVTSSDFVITSNFLLARYKNILWWRNTGDPLLLWHS